MRIKGLLMSGLPHLRGLRMLPGINIKPYINVKLTECKNTSQITLYSLNIDKKNGSVNINCHF